MSRRDNAIRAQLQCAIDLEIAIWLREEAAKQQKSINDFVRDLLNEAKKESER